MINLKIRQDAYKKIKNNLQYSLLVAFCAQILSIVLKLYVSSFVTEDFIYSIQDGIVPEIGIEQINILKFLLLAIMVINPILKLGATKYFLKLYRGKEVKFSDILAYIKRPFRAWIAYLFLMLLYAAWIIVPAGVYYLMITLLPRNIVFMFSWLLYIPVFYAGIRYFAYIYIISEDDSIGYIKAAKKSAAILKGNGILLLSMLAYFLLINMIFAMLDGVLLSLGVFGTTVSLVINLAIRTWMLASLAGLYCFLHGENIGIIVENIKIENEEDLKKFLNNKFKMLERHDNKDNIEVPFFSPKKNDEENNDNDNADDNDNGNNNDNDNDNGDDNCNANDNDNCDDNDNDNDNSK